MDNNLSKKIAAKIRQSNQRVLERIDDERRKRNRKQLEDHFCNYNEEVLYFDQNIAADILASNDQFLVDEDINNMQKDYAADILASDDQFLVDQDINNMQKDYAADILSSDDQFLVDQDINNMQKDYAPDILASDDQFLVDQDINNMQKDYDSYEKWFTDDDLDHELVSNSDFDSEYEINNREGYKNDANYENSDSDGDNNSNYDLDEYDDDDDDDSEKEYEEKRKYYKYVIDNELRRNIDDLEFNVVSIAEGMIRNVSQNFNEGEFNLFAKDNSEETTIGEFSRELHDYFVVNQITQRSQIDLLRFLQRNFGQRFNIPLGESKKKNKIVYQNLLPKYSRLSNRCIQFDVCKEYCCVFVGSNENKRFCPICKTPRYYKCSNKTCATKMCEEDTCTHSLDSRKPLKSINYQCILPLFCRLAENKVFMKCINYEHVKNRNFKYSDVTDGKCFKRNMKEMQKRHADVVRNRNLKENIEQLNINIAITYDGVQVYRHKCSTFNPLMMTILNLPPSFRSSVGVGMFLLSLFTLKEKTEAEYFIFHKCLLKELEALKSGYLYRFRNRLILIQVRLITLLLDTPMVSKQLKWQGHTSYAACAICGDIYGMSGNGGGSGGGSRRVGHRCYLDIKHFLRSWGQSEQCCPPGYYSNRVPDIELKASHECTVPLNICRDVKRICDNENLESVKSFMLDKNATWVWHHSDTEFHSEPKVLLNYLYYPHVDYRAQIEYKRVTYDLSSYNDKTDERPTGLNYKPWFLYLGYFRVEESLTWCVFHAKMGAGRHTLREFTNESLTDKKGPYKEYLKRVLCHPYLYNVEHENDGATDSTNKNNKNDNDNNNNKSKVTDRRTLEEFVREKNRTLTKEHGKNQPKYAKLPTDYLYRIPWKVSKPELKLMEVYVNSLHVPGGLSDKFQLHDILSRLGQLRGAEVINIVEDLLDYILIPSSMPIAYKQYYSMFSEDIREMGKPVIKDKNEIDRIFLKVVETISLHEGMFPIFFSDFTYHELIDIVKHIQYQGPQKAFSTFSGERANAVLKKFVRKGGRNSTKTVLNSYLHVEAYNTSKAYSVKLEDAEIPSGLCHNLRKLLIFHSKNDGSIDRYEYNPFIFTMRKRDEFQDILTDFEMANLLSTLLIEVEKQSTSKENAKSTSSLYFIYCQWLRKYPERGNISKIGLHDRFYRYVKESSDHNSFPIISEFLALRHKIQKSCYRTCLIYGTEFVSRGMIERIKDSEDFLRDMNDFRISWSTKKQYSSWCQYKTKFKQAFTGINDPEFGSDLSGKKFAQINGFFRVSLPSDSILNNIPIACVSDRKCKEFERVLRYEVDNQNIDGLSNLFIAATNIVPCRQLIAGFDSSNKPWKFRGNTGDDLHSHAKKCQIVYILCVPLDKKNDCIPYCIDHNCYYNFTEFDNYQ